MGIRILTYYYIYFNNVKIIKITGTTTLVISHHNIEIINYSNYWLSQIIVFIQL